MESNKLMIGVQFTSIVGDISNQKKVSKHIELIVLRDTTLKQLLDGIRYGLEKKDTDPIYHYCNEIFKQCMTQMDGNRFRCMTLTSYNQAVKVRTIEKNGIIQVSLTTDDLQKSIEEIGFISSTRIVFDTGGNYASAELTTSSSIIPAFNSEYQKEKIFPEYNISSRQLDKFDDTPVEIIPPSEMPQEQEQNLFFTILPTLMMVGTMILVRGVIMNNGSGTSMIILSVSMSVITLFTSILTYFRQKKQYKTRLKTWREQYEAYINKVIANIKIRKNEDVSKLNGLYPDVNQRLNDENLTQNIKSICKDIFSRSCADRDFLTVRLGNSNQVKNMFEIKGGEKDAVFSPANFLLEDDQVTILLPGDDNYLQIDDKHFYLSNLPGYIAKTYQYMENAPLLFSLKNCGALGIVAPDQNFLFYLTERIIFDLCFHHAPEDLQFIILFPPSKNWDKQESYVKNYKFLPHFHGFLSNRAQFVFDSESANAVFGIMLNIMAERNESNSRSLPHIIMILYEEYGIKEHALAQYLPQVPEEDQPFVNTTGVTFIFPKQYTEHLPKYCNYIISKMNDRPAKLIPRENASEEKEFRFHIIEPKKWGQDLYDSYKILSALCYSQISQNGKVPSNVSLFDLYHLQKDHINIASFWDNEDGKRPYDITESLSVPIGFSDSGVTTLDLHEKYDGPHMLIAGTTGSGKSETVISYLLGLCLCYRPDEINLMLVDMKGGGFIKRIGTLPHVVGSVTDVDGDENGTGAVYMLKRFLDALSSEIRRRKILFNSMHVDSITGYIKACRDIDSHINALKQQLKKEKTELTPQEEQEIRNQAQKEPLSHLILVVDEFTELKRFSTENDDIDFIGEITTIARVGRSLGFHIILISQNIEGAITDDIRVNSKSRLCLKVATRQASKEMIGNDLAASPTMPGNGRAYLLVGTGSKFEYFQSAYSGADVEENLEAPVEFVEASKSGAYTIFYRSEKDNQELRQRKKELDAAGLLETQLNAVVGAIKTHYKENISRYIQPHIVFQKPLPDQMYLKDGKIYEFHDGAYQFMKEADMHE